MVLKKYALLYIFVLSDSFWNVWNQIQIPSQLKLQSSWRKGRGEEEQQRETLKSGSIRKPVQKNRLLVLLNLFYTRLFIVFFAYQEIQLVDEKLYE